MTKIHGSLNFSGRTLCGSHARKNVEWSGGYVKKRNVTCKKCLLKLKEVEKALDKKMKKIKMLSEL